MDLKRIPIKEAVTAGGLLIAGWAAWDDVRDLSTANAQSIDGLAEALEELDEDNDTQDGKISDIQRVLIQRAGEQKLEIQELRGDVKLILRLLEEKEN